MKYKLIEQLSLAAVEGQTRNLQKHLLFRQFGQEQGGEDND